MSKRTVMLVALASVLGLGTACFGLFTSKSPPPATQDACEGLEGQALIDCRNVEKQ